MKSVMPESLEKFVPNEWRKIQESAENLDELLTATYTRTLAKDCFDFYKPFFEPLIPQGWLDAYQKYEAVSPDKRTEVWRIIEQKFSGYLKARAHAKSSNDSNKFFLKEMLEHFKKVGLLNYAERCRERLLDFESVLVAR